MFNLARIHMHTLALLALPLVLSCNFFDPFDTPTNDDQLKSAARACLDQADYACALEYYGKLAASESDVANSELAFTILSQNGASFGAFAIAIGTGGGVAGFNKLAEILVPGAGEAKRKEIYRAYRMHRSIKNTDLKNLTRFVTAAALASAILAETTTAGVLRKSDIAITGGACATDTPPCAENPDCGAPAGGKIATTASGDIASDAGAEPTGATPTLDQLFYSINEAVNGMDALGAGSGFSGIAASFKKVKDVGVPSRGSAQANCFRKELISQGFGG